jgi:Peptidase family M23
MQQQAHGFQTSPRAPFLYCSHSTALRFCAIAKPLPRKRSLELLTAQPINLFGFNSIPFFYAGPGGYDAVVVARANEMRDLGLSFSDPIYIDVSGSAFLYELAEPTGMIEWPTRGLNEFPGVRRVFLDDAVRYTFVRYGVPYVISIDCFDGGSRFRTISCREADKVAVRALKSLRLVGGMPQAAGTSSGVLTIDRPTIQSTVFTYHSPGDLIAGTGFKDKRGVADYTVFSGMRFPIAQAPAFANSQSFLNSGDCESSGWSSAGTRDGLPAYRCRVSGQALVWDEAAGENYSYPWRDNFCEMRHFQVGQCPAGLGHQGQDIRPALCRQRAPGDRCEPYIHDVVAARDGMVLRAPGQAGLYLVVNAPGERVRFRYLHMLPKQLDATGMVSGRLVREGEIIGKVGNFLGGATATTYHLHFDLQVPTKYGWVFVNPYMTLVASYERLIEARGQEIKENIPAVPSGVAATQTAQ